MSTLCQNRVSSSDKEEDGRDVSRKGEFELKREVFWCFFVNIKKDLNILNSFNFWMFEFKPKWKQINQLIEKIFLCEIENESLFKFCELYYDI